MPTVDPGSGCYPSNAHKKSAKISGARFMAETFRGYGLTHVFFIPTVLRQTLVEMEAVGIRRVLTHSEKAAAYMADGYARVSRRPGVCMAQSVGAANLAAGLQDPYLGLSPVIALTGKKRPFAQHRNAYQEIRHDLMFAAVTKSSVAVETLEQLPHLIRQALRDATSGAPGPVHLDVAGGVAGEAIESASGELPVIVETPFTGYPALRVEPDGEHLKAAARMLVSARRAVIVAGGGAAASMAGPEILRLAERLSIPVATSLNAKGIIPENHPHSIGVVGSYSRWCANRVVAEADLVMFVGSRTGDQVTNGWTVPVPGTAVIQIDIDPAEPGRNYAGGVAICGDAKVTLDRLAGLIGGPSGQDDWFRHARDLVAQWRDEYVPLLHSAATPIRTERLCSELERMLPSDAILVADTGYAGIWTGAMVDLKHSGQSYIRAAGSLGWGFPASLGAKCAAPQRPVVCFTGEGGFWYHLSELETARRCGIHTVTVVNNNHSLCQCIDAIQGAHGDRPGCPEELFLYNDVDFARLARQMGCFGIRVEQPGDIAAALEQALESDLPAVVDVVTDLNCRAPDPWSPS